MSNAERQRQFRASHPGYNKRFKYEPSKEQVRAAIAKAMADAEALHNGTAAAQVPMASDGQFLLFAA